MVRLLLQISWDVVPSSHNHGSKEVQQSSDKAMQDAWNIIYQSNIPDTATRITTPFDIILSGDALFVVAVGVGTPEEV